MTKISARTKKKIQDLIKSRRSASDDDIEEDRQIVQEAYDDAVKGGDPREICRALGTIPEPDLKLGNRSIAKGDDSGWPVIERRNWLYAYAWISTGIPSAEVVRELGPMLLHLQLFDVPFVADGVKEMRAAIKANSDDDEELDTAWFAIWCHEMHATGKSSAAPEGPFGKLVKAVKKDEVPQDLLIEACEFQLKNAGRDDSDAHEWIQYPLTPFWFFAYARTRQKLGLSTEKPEHPLFETPFAEIPLKSSFNPKKDDLAAKLNAALAKVKKK